MATPASTASPERRVRTICRMCHGGCGAVVTIRGDRIVAIAGDRDNPNNRGFLCAKGRASIDHLYHPDRLRHPLRRTGPRGSGSFARIGWDEALDEVAAALDRARRQDGPHSVVFAQGTDRNYQEWLFRFANAFGSPNVLGPAHVCFYPRVMAGILTMGAFTFCDYEGDPDVVVVWGSNKAVTHGDGVIGTRLLHALGRGTRMIVIDPRRTALAARARLWLRPRPGTDAALALGLLHVVIASGRYDHEFVAAYTEGFAELREHVMAYPPERVAAITGVPADLIRAAAELYAGAEKAAIELGTGVQQNKNSFHTARAALLLSAICGNIDRPGGDVIWDPPGIIGRRAMPRSEALPPEQAARRLGGDRYRVLGMSGWAHPDAVWSAILEGEPYRVGTMAIFGSNPLVSYADAERVRRALHALDFLVVSDLFLTPTAALADIVLPVSGWLERDQIVEHANYVAARRALVRIGECRSDEEILNELARRLGLAGFWESAADSLDARLAPIGMTWRRLAEVGYRPTPLRYHKYRERGFATPSGKLALYSRALQRMGYEPLPVYLPPAGDSGPYLLTSGHSPYYFNSEFRNVAALRRREPDPVVELHPETAARERIRDGEWVRLRAKGRAVTMRARVTDRIAPGVLSASAAWWYPEEGADGWRRSNLNLLTTEEDASPEMGSSNFRGIGCAIEKIDAAAGDGP